MDKYISAFLAFAAVAKVAAVAFAAYVAPFLVKMLIPSIVVALTNKPKAGGVVAALLKVSHFVSMFTHVDEPGTLKAPFGLGALASAGASAFKSFWSEIKSAPKGPALALFLIASLSLSGCAWLAKHPTLSRVLNCGEQAIVEGLPSLMGDVLAALSGGSPDWSSLGTLEAAHGADLIACAVKQATAQAEQISGGATYGAAVRGMASRVSANGNAFLKARGVR